MPLEEFLISSVRVSDMELFSLYLNERHANPNASKKITDVRKTRLVPINERSAKTMEKEYVEEGVWFVNINSLLEIPVLFWSIRGIFEHAKGQDKLRKSAMDIFLSLIDAGADLTISIKSVGVANIPGYQYRTRTLTPESFTMFLREHANTSESKSAMNEVLQILNQNIAGGRIGGGGAGGRFKQAMVLVPQIALETWQGLLFDEKFSDVSTTSSV
jgi:hypothetical protein